MNQIMHARDLRVGYFMHEYRAHIERYMWAAGMVFVLLSNGYHLELCPGSRVVADIRY